MLTLLHSLKLSGRFLTSCSAFRMTSCRFAPRQKYLLPLPYTVNSLHCGDLFVAQRDERVNMGGAARRNIHGQAGHRR